MPHILNLARLRGARQGAAMAAALACTALSLLAMLSCKQSSSGRLGSVGSEGEPGSGTSGQGMIRAVQGQLDFDLKPQGAGAAGTGGIAAAPSSGNVPLGQQPSGVVGQPIRILDPKAATNTISASVSASAAGAGTVRMEFAIALDEPVRQLTDLHGSEGGSGAALRRIGSLSTSNLIFEPETLRTIAEETGRALYLLPSSGCGVAERCVRLTTGGDALKEDKQGTIRLELRETQSGQWILKGFRYYGHAIEGDYGMPVRLLMTDRFDG